MKRTVKTAACILAFLLAAVAFVGCEKKDEYQKRYIFAMDTDINIYISSEGDVSELIDECETLIYSLEDKISKTRKESDVYRLNSGERVTCDPVTLSLLETAKYIYGISGGAFDPTVEGLVSMWKSCGSENSLPSKDTLEAELSEVGFDKVHIENGEVWLDPGTSVDLGGIGKGYAQQAVAELIKEKAQAFGVRGYMLDFGGMVGVFGEKSNGEKYNIGIKDPDDKTKNRGKIALGEGFVSVSGDYERFVTVGGERYHHIIDPKTGYPADSAVRSVAVICDNGALADALSTALFVMGYDDAEELYKSGAAEFEAVFFMKDGSTKKTAGVDYSD